MGSWPVQMERPGKRQGGHTVAGDLGGRSLKKRSGKPLQGASARVAWRGRCRGQRRSFWNWRKGEGGLVAAAMANGGDGDSRVSSGKGVRGGREGAASEGEVRGGRRGAWRHRGVEEEAGGGRAGWRWRARRRRGVCPPGREEDDRGGGDGLGWPGGPGGLQR